MRVRYGRYLGIEWTYEAHDVSKSMPTSTFYQKPTKSKHFAPSGFQVFTSTSEIAIAWQQLTGEQL
eukprot:6214674-Pleurochrysis_carterae.AAC.5